MLMALSKPDESTLRRVRECCTQLHSCLLKWREARNSGVQTANEFVNNKIATNSTSWPAKHALSQCLKSLDEAHATIGTLTGNVQAVHRLTLRRMKHNCIDQTAAPLFHTLSAAQFVNNFETILAAYSQQLSLCHDIASQLDATNDRDKLILYQSMWKHEPYIDEDVRLKVEALLTETDLR